MLSKLCKVVVYTCCLLILCSSAATQAETFRNPFRIPTPSDPASIAVGDLNGDGIADIVWVDKTNLHGTINVMLSQPGGGYLPGPVVMAASSTLYTGICVLTDVNNDAHLDLVCSAALTTQAYIWVFLGHGDGTFDPPRTTPISAQSANYVVEGVAALGDVNGDGFQDIFYEDGANNIFLVMLSDGKGGFQSPKRVGIAFIDGGLGVAADVNGDGIPDLLGRLGPTVALGKGDGTFSTPMNYSQPFDYTSVCVYHDMDGDGHLDAVCGYDETFGIDITGGTDLIILHGNTDGSFNPIPIAHQVFGDHTNEFDGFGTFEQPIAVADLNGDGIPDIVAIAGDGLTVLMGEPGLRFGKPRHYAQASIDFGYAELGYPSQFLDANGDGIPDLVSAGPNGIYISYGHADGTFGSAPAYEVTEVIGYATVADFNGDGIPDVAATGDANIKVSLGKGDGTFADPVAVLNGTLSSAGPILNPGVSLLHGDFNGDGKIDLLGIGTGLLTGYQSFLSFGNGDGTFQPPIPAVSGSQTVFTQPSDAAVYDVNHDGRSDLLSVLNPVTASDSISVALSNGDGSFRTVTTAAPTDPSEYGFYYRNTRPVLADFFGHGQLDAAYGSLNNVYVLKGHGDGTFDQTGTAMAIPSIGGRPSMGAVSVAGGDFDGDGKPDFVVLVQYDSGVQLLYTSPGSTAAWVFFGNGDGTFAAPVLAGTFDRNYVEISAADLNRDGLSDIVLNTGGTLAGGHAVGVVNVEPGRSFADETNYTAGTGLSSASIADLNGDGFPDLLFANGDYNIRASSVTVLLNLGNVPLVTGTLVALPEPSDIGQPFHLTASLFPPIPGAHLAGDVSFSIDGSPLGTATLVNNAATIVAPGTLPAGIHQITATWPGDGTYHAVHMTGSHVVSAPASPSSLSLTSSANPAPALTPITFTLHLAIGGHDAPAGTTVSLLAGPGTPGQLTTDAGGSATFTISTFAAGTYLITASFGGAPGTLPSSVSLIETVTASSIAPTATTLLASPNPANQGQAVTLSASVTAGASPVSTGTVNFYDGLALLGAGALSTSGQASLLTSSLAPGTHPLTAAFSATGSIASSTSAVVQEVILASHPTSAFTLALAPSTLTMVSGQQGSVAILLTSVGDFAGPLSLSYGALPTALSASLQPPSVTLAAGATGRSTLLLNTYALASNTPSPRQNSRHWPALAAVLLLPALTAFGNRRNRRLFGVLLAAALLQALTGCTNTWHEGSLAAPGTYQIPITATDANNRSQTATLTLVVTP